ncbi:HAD family hydrolase [Actinomycetes bacterium NPDC127524]
MIFASDLDQTLIYSKRSARVGLDEKWPDTILAETLEEREISYMTNEAAALLKKVNGMMTFLPVTTRTIEQYKRIFFISEVIQPKAAVTSNGGNILIDGKADEEWKRRIAGRLIGESSPKEDIQKEFSRISHSNWIIEERTADDLFHYYLIQQDLAPRDEIEQFKKAAAAMGWNLSLQGRKLYFVPQCINKWEAVAYLKDLFREDVIAASGDSMLDLCMLEAADYAIAPCHGELNIMTDSPAEPLLRTEQKGIKAAEEILTHVLKVYEEHKMNIHGASIS